ncbi:MAG: hypothetical protein KJO17_03545, partial [Acidimicrobiia bacterium]|nr:hypothetical protein [Acidimicrobiia bacterium]
MTDRMDPKMRELTYRLIEMAPEAPPFPEEPMVQLQPTPKPASPASRPRRLVWVAAGAAVTIALIGTPLVMGVLSSETDPTTPATQATVPDTAATTLPDQPTPTTIDPAPTTMAPNPNELPPLSAGTVVIAEPGAATTSTDDVVVYDADVAVADEAGELVIQRDGMI